MPGILSRGKNETVGPLCGVDAMIRTIVITDPLSTEEEELADIVSGLSRMGLEVDVIEHWMGMRDIDIVLDEEIESLDDFLEAL